MSRRVAGVCAVVGGLAAGLGVVGGARTARGEIIFSNYGPGMTYNTTSAPGDAGALWNYNWHVDTDWDYFTSITYASFTTPAGADWFPTSITLAANTYHDVDVFIVADAGGVPSGTFGSLGYGESLDGSPIDNNLHGFGYHDGNVTIGMLPGNDIDPEWHSYVPKPMKGGTTYWVMFMQEWQEFGTWGFDDDKSWSKWYRSSNDANAPANSTYVYNDTDLGPSGGYFVQGARPVFQIEATAVPVPEPTAAIALSAVASIALLRRRKA